MAILQEMVMNLTRDICSAFKLLKHILQYPGTNWLKYWACIKLKQNIFIQLLPINDAV